MTLTPKTQLGRSLEQHVRRQCEAQGWQHLASNWRCEVGEIDLVMRDGDEIAFIEVKTRRGERSGQAEEVLSRAQGRRLLASAEWFVQDHPECDGLIWRIDLVAITLDQQGGIARYRHFVNAVQSDE